MKKNLKKLILLLAVVTTALVCFAFSASALEATGQCGDNVYWEYNAETGELVISGEGEMYDYEDLESPFFSDTDLKTVVFKDSVTSIGKHAFGDCFSLENIEIGDSLTSIGDYAFSGCDSLASVTIPDSVTNIGKDAFGDCSSLKNIEIGDSVTSIGDHAFSGCDSLASVTIPDSVTSIGYGVLSDCNSLTSITVDENNPNYSNNEHGALFNKAKTDLIQYPAGNTTTSYSIPNSVTSIGDGAFSGCNSITSVTIPDSVTSIGNVAFWGCDSLISVTIPDSVTSIGESAFSNCNSLTSVTIPDSITSIGESAFSDCNSLTSVTIPNNVISIGDYAFFNCYSLTNVTIPDSVTIIGDYAFYDCYSLTSVTIPDSVTIIEDFAFSCCNSLRSVAIPDSVISIDNGAFSSCKSLTSIIVDDNNLNYSNDETGVLFDKEKTKLIQYPVGNNITSYSVPNSVIGIGNRAFSNCDSLTSVIIPDSVTSIGFYAFLFCTNLRNITIPNSVTNIYYGTFDGCDNLQNVYYTGTEEQWKNIYISSGNSDLLNANIIFLGDEKITDGNITECTHENKASYPQQNATCEETGLTAGEFCSDCETWLVERKEIPATDHNYKLEDSKEPTCSESGYKTYVCENDVNHGYTEITDMLPHTEIKYDGKAPTCTKSGWSEYFICSVCGYSSYEELEALGHTEVIQKAVAATCLKTGLTEGKYCSVCRKILVAQQIIGLTEHSFTNFISDNNATFTADGTKTAKCDYCTETKTVTDEGSMLKLGVTAKIIASQSTSEIKLKWSPAENATGYRIYFKLPGDKNWIQCVSYVTATTHTFKNLPSGRAYCFAVRSVGLETDGTVVFGPYAEISTTTKAPAPAKITAAQNTTAIRLTWTKCSGATGYRIFYKTATGWKICLKATTATSHTFTGLKAGSKFTFAVRPYIITDSGVVWSDYTTYTAATLPAIPKTAVASPSSGKITVKWNAVSGAEAYQLFYKTGNGDYKLYKNYFSVQTVNFSGLKSGTKYTFAVRAAKNTSGGWIFGSFTPVSVTVK